MGIVSIIIQPFPSLSQTDLGSGVPLKVMVFHSAVAAHQTNAILCLSLLKELAEKLGEDGSERYMWQQLLQQLRKLYMY